MNAIHVHGIDLYMTFPTCPCHIQVGCLGEGILCVPYFMIAVAILAEGSFFIGSLCHLFSMDALVVFKVFIGLGSTLRVSPIMATDAVNPLRRFPVRYLDRIKMTTSAGFFGVNRALYYILINIKMLYSTTGINLFEIRLSMADQALLNPGFSRRW